MDNLKNFQIQIDKQLQRATDFERIQFGLDICNRLLLDYKAFELKDKWGDSSLLTEAIKFINISKNKGNIDLGKLDSLISLIDKVIPDTEDFSDWEVSYALNASVSILELLSYLKDKDYNHILTISTLMTDNIDFKIQMSNTDLTDNEIDCHPMLIDEFKYQLEIIK
ncbi:DUF416 family protein [Saccharicrinis sp. FJH2]|uniref:DUF416 family protein n=1 Tax=Saccharicrinis sp. FJH65 TaxID=3344659 RepID=UPI0035F4CF64